MKTVTGSGSPRYRALLALLRAADTVWNASRAFFARWNLSPSEFNVLNVLADHPNGLSQTELGHELLMHRSNITGLVDRLGKAGLVDRREVASDRRAYAVVLTPAGSRLRQEILPHYYEAAERTAEGLSPARASALAEDLKLISGNSLRIAEGSKGNGVKA